MAAQLAILSKKANPSTQMLVLVVAGASVIQGQEGYEVGADASRLLVHSMISEDRYKRLMSITHYQ